MRTAACWGLAAACAAAPLWAAGVEPGAAEAARVAELAALYGTQPELVRSLRALGLDWVDAECAVAISTRAQRPVGEVLDLRAAGMGWGQIAQGYGFMLTDAVRGTGLRDAPADLPSGRRKAPKPAAKRTRSAPPSRERFPR